MYRIRFPEGGLSDMVNLTRAKDAAIALALQSLNSGAQNVSASGLRSQKASEGREGSGRRQSSLRGS